MAQPPAAGGLDAQPLLRFPWVVIGTLAAIAGAIDAIDFRAFGVFTANQAGNLVLVWVRLSENPTQSLLSLLSIIGCALGIALVVVLRATLFRTHPKGAVPMTFIAAALVILVTAVLSLRVGDVEQVQELLTASVNSADWWSMVLLVGASAFAMGVLGTTITSVATTPVTIIGSTGAYLTMVRLWTAHLVGREGSSPLLWRISVVPLCWTGGAAVATFLPIGRGFLAGFAAIILLGIAAVIRRVGLHPSP